jgi:hypothetical protein
VKARPALTWFAEAVGLRTAAADRGRRRLPVYADAIGGDAEEDDIATNDVKARPFANLGAKLKKKGLLCDLPDFAPNLPNDFDGALRIFVG